MPAINAFQWTLRSIRGGKGKTHYINAEFRLPTVRMKECKKNVPLKVNFEIHSRLGSDFKVNYLKIKEREGYESHPWVRYITKNGEYEFDLL